jgi:dienelactone hydrolase
MVTASPRSRAPRVLALLLATAMVVPLVAHRTLAADATAIPCAPSARPFGVGRTTLSVSVGAGRTLSTTYAYPAVHGESGTGATPACGSFPIVVVAHGSAGTGASAVDLHTYLVRGGYTLVAPTFPSGFDLTRDARDASRVLTAILRRDARDTLPNAGHLRRGKVGFIGTSLGGMIGLTLYRDCCLDRRFDAIIPKLATGIGTRYRWKAGPPLLMINGTADTVVSYDDALATYQRAKHLKGLVTLHGIGHDLLVGTDPILQESSLGFFARFLEGKASGLRRIVWAARDSDIATLRRSW